MDGSYGARRGLGCGRLWRGDRSSPPEPGGGNSHVMSSIRFLASRFAGCTQGVLDRCVRAVVTAADLEEVVHGFSAHRVALVARDVIEVLEAGDLVDGDPPGSDWLRTIVAEGRFFEADRLRRQGDQQGARAAWDRARDILEEVAASSDRSSVLWYDDIYFEAVQALLRRRDRKALVRQMECVAEGLNDADCPNLDAQLRDLALVHLELGDYGSSTCRHRFFGRKRRLA
jgi:hypothetical protein